MFIVAPQSLWAQGVDEKPTQILPERDNLPSDQSSSDKTRDSNPQITVDLPLFDESDALDRSEFVIGGVQVDDDGLLPPGAYGKVAENFVGRRASPAALKALAKAVADESRAEGYIFASAKIPAQSIKMGIVRVKVDVGMIDSVSLKGTKNKFVKRLFENLEGKPGTKTAIERAIFTASNYPGISIDKTSFRRKYGKGILTIRVSRVADQLQVTFDNYGTQTSGPVRARLAVDKHGVFSDRDWLGAQLLMTPTDPEELTFVSARYSNIVTDGGTRLALTGAAGRTKRTLEDGTIIAKSRSRFAAVTMITPLIQSNKADISLNIEGGFLALDRNFSDGRFRDDDIATVSASASGNAKVAGGRLAGGVAVIRGLDILAATQANDPIASRSDGSGQFSKGELWLNWTRKLGQGFSVRTAVSGQVASRPLLSSQEIDLGGPRFGRGFDYSERSGDQGVLASFELRKFVSKSAKNISSAQFYAFVDGGYVDNLRLGSGGGSLVSTGGGVRASIGKIDFGVEVAVPVKGQRESGGKSPKLNATIAFSF